MEIFNKYFYNTFEQRFLNYDNVNTHSYFLFPQDIMNVILFCRILYVDVEAVFPSMVQNNISIEKCSDSPETVNAQKEVQNLDFVGVTEKDLTEEISSEQFSTESFSNNQNFVNGCQKRREWTQESLGD